MWLKNEHDVVLHLKAKREGLLGPGQMRGDQPDRAAELDRKINDAAMFGGLGGHAWLLCKRLDTTSLRGAHPHSIWNHSPAKQATQARTGDEQAEQLAEGEQLRVDLFGRAVPVVRTPDGLRAVSKGKPGNPAQIEKYLTGKFGDRLEEAPAGDGRAGGSL